MTGAFALQKLHTIFQQKNIGVLQILAFEIFTELNLMTSLVLNNQAQTY